METLFIGFVSKMEKVYGVGQPPKASILFANYVKLYMK